MTDNELYAFAEQEGITIDIISVPQNKSLSVHLDNRFYVAIDETIMETSSDKRVHLAHELGHCATNSFYNLYAPLDLREKHEYHANKWAVTNLIPKSELVALLKNGYEKWSIAEYFNVTEDFVNLAIYMYFEMGIAV